MVNLFHTNSRGEKYTFCGCGMVVWGGENRLCPRHIKRGYKPLKKRSKDFSGDSKYRVEQGQYQSKEGR